MAHPSRGADHRSWREAAARVAVRAGLAFPASVARTSGRRRRQQAKTHQRCRPLPHPDDTRCADVPSAYCHGYYVQVIVLLCAVVFCVIVVVLRRPPTSTSGLVPSGSGLAATWHVSSSSSSCFLRCVVVRCVLCLFVPPRRASSPCGGVAHGVVRRRRPPLRRRRHFFSCAYQIKPRVAPLGFALCPVIDESEHLPRVWTMTRSRGSALYLVRAESEHCLGFGL